MIKSSQTLAMEHCPQNIECNHSLGKVPDLVRGGERYQQNTVGLTSVHSFRP